MEEYNASLARFLRYLYHQNWRVFNEILHLAKSSMYIKRREDLSMYQEGSPLKPLCSLIQYNPSGDLTKPIEASLKGSFFKFYIETIARMPLEDFLSQTNLPRFLDPLPFQLSTIRALCKYVQNNCAAAVIKVIRDICTICKFDIEIATLTLWNMDANKSSRFKALSEKDKILYSFPARNGTLTELKAFLKTSSLEITYLILLDNCISYCDIIANRNSIEKALLPMIVNIPCALNDCRFFEMLLQGP